MSQAKKSLLIALRENKPDKVRNLLKKNPKELSANEEADSARNRILHRAARYGHSEITEILIKGLVAR